MSRESPVGTYYARTVDVVGVAVYLLLLLMLLSVVLIEAWPLPPLDANGNPATGVKSIHLFGGTLRLSRESCFFVVALVAGGIGALAHALRSLYWYVGNRSLRRSWLLMYLFLPFVGAALGLVVYLVVRGGLTTTMASSADINPYGVTAIAALVGLFSRETAEKLRAVFSVLLAPAAPGKDQALSPQVHSVEPRAARAGDVVTIRGLALSSVTTVRFGTAEARAEVVSDTEIRVTVPSGAGSGPIVVRTPGDEGPSAVEFTVE